MGRQDAFDPVWDKGAGAFAPSPSFPHGSISLPIATFHRLTPAEPRPLAGAGGAMGAVLGTHHSDSPLHSRGREHRHPRYPSQAALDPQLIDPRG